MDQAQPPGERIVAGDGQAAGGSSAAAQGRPRLTRRARLRTPTGDARAAGLVLGRSLASAARDAGREPPRRGPQSLTMPGEQFLAQPVRLTPDDVDAAAEMIGCDAAFVWAVLDVETNARGVGRFGRVRALFEPHLFDRETAGRFRATHPTLSSPRWDPSRYGAPPHGVFQQIDAAARLDREAALRSTSWGVGQILGQNARVCGYPSADAMVEAFVEGEPEQLRAFVRFCRATGVDSAMRAGDIHAFARSYNGPAYATHGYHRKLARALERRMRGAPAFRIFRVGATGDGVTELQAKLGEAGYPVPVDGVFGPTTQAAVRRFQAARGLVVDGVVGARTWEALGAARTAATAEAAPARDVVEPAATATAGGVIGGFSVLQALEELNVPALDAVVRGLSVIPPWAWYGVAAFAVGGIGLRLWRWWSGRQS